MAICASLFRFHLSVDLKSFSRTVEKVDATMAQVDEQRQVAEEIGNIISNPLNSGVEMDEVRLMLSEVDSVR
jgi:hypothetical protein